MTSATYVSQEDETLFYMKWVFEKQPAIQKTGGQVKRTHGYSYTYDYELQLNMCDPGIGPKLTIRHSFQFLMTTQPGQNDGSNPTNDGDAIPDYYRLPCDMWLKFTNDTTKISFEKDSESQWKSKTISIESLHDTFGVVLWIKFNSIGIGELNAVRRMAELLVQQTRCDVQFIFENGRSIGGHVAILSASSPVFEAMFTNDMMEAKTGQVVITDIQADIFKELLHYIYAGHTCTPLTEHTAQSLYEAAEKYDIQDLRKKCLDFLLFQIKMNNAINLMIWADVHSIDKIKQAALKFVAENFRTICPTTEWETLVKNHPELCLLATRMMK